VTFQHSSVKGCLELQGYAVSVSEKKAHTFIVSNLREMNYYELTAASDDAMHQWVEHIRTSIQATEVVEGASPGGQPNDQQLAVRPPLTQIHTSQFIYLFSNFEMFRFISFFVLRLGFRFVLRLNYFF
jgi:hypothetical protein